VMEQADLEGFVDAVIAHFGTLDILVNNAGGAGDLQPLVNLSDHAFDEAMKWNVYSTFWATRRALPTMLEKGDGRIINISSMAAKRGSANNSVYCATKFGMNGLTQSLAKELGPQGIRVNAICPVLVRTDGLIEALSREDSPAKGDPETFLENFRKANAALDHLPTGEEVGNYAVWLASDRASAMTGQCVNVDCGVFPQ